MLEEMDAVHITEWLAFDKIQHDEQTRARLAVKAEAGIDSYNRRGR